LRFLGLILRDNTERRESVIIVTMNWLEPSPSKLVSALSRLMKGQWKKEIIPPLQDGTGAERMLKHLVEMRWANLARDLQ
jgi:UDP-N-acetylglucosamine 2-epimerase